MNIPSVAKNSLKIVAHIVLGLCAIVLIPSLLAQIAVFPIISSFVELDQEPQRNVSGFVVLALTVLAYVIFVRFYEKRPCPELELRGNVTPLLFGTISGALMLGVTILSLFAMGYYKITLYNGLREMIFVLFGLSVIAIGEEFIFRGVLFRILEQYTGTIYALVSTSILFMIANLAISGMIFSFALSSFLISALWCAIYVWSRNIWVVSFHHAAWNYAEFSSGILDEHWRVSAPIESEGNGPILMTGGALGPEGSIITMVICLIGLIFIHRRVALMHSTPATAINSQKILNQEERSL